MLRCWNLWSGNHDFLSWGASPFRSYFSPLVIFWGFHSDCFLCLFAIYHLNLNHKLAEVRNILGLVQRMELSVWKLVSGDSPAKLKAVGLMDSSPACSVFLFAVNWHSGPHMGTFFWVKVSFILWIAFYIIKPLFGLIATYIPGCEYSPHIVHIVTWVKSRSLAFLNTEMN